MNSSQTQINLIEQLAKAKSSLNIFFVLSLDLCCIRGQDGYFKNLNPSWEKVLGWTSSELLCTPWLEFVHPDDVEVTLKAETPGSKEYVAEYENRYRHNDGSYRWLSWRVLQDKDGLSYGVAKDITATKQAEEVLSEGAAPTLRDRLELERLITTLSTQFINLSWAEIDDGIEQALQVIGEFAGFDRSSIVLFGDREAGERANATDNLEAKLAYQWSAESIEPWPREVAQASPASFPWWMEKLRHFEAIQVSCRAELPPEADNERRAMQLAGAQAFIAVPLVQGNSLIGYVAFAVLKEEKTWSDDIVALLKIIGDIFANALNRKQVESKLRESERRLSAVFNQTFQSSILLNLDGRVLEENQTAMDFCKLDRSQVVGHPLWELKCWTISPETQERLRKAIAEAALGNIVCYQVDILAPDNTVVTIDFALKPLKDETGQVELLIAEARDLTECKRTESALRESEERWQLALRGNNDSIWDFNFKTNQCFHSPRWINILGYEEHEFSDYWDDWEARVHPDDLGRVKLVRQEHLEGKTPHYIAEYRVRCKDGSYKWILSRAQALWDEAGNPLRIVGSHTDITERKQSEEALKASEARFRSLCACSPVGIFLTDAEGRCMYANPCLLRLAGLTFEEILGEGWVQSVHPGDQQWVFADWSACAQGGQECLHEYRIQTPKGIVRWVQARTSPMLSERGQLIGHVGTIEDITERKQAEASLQQAFSELETKVEERTADLKQANEQLQSEIAERQRTAVALAQREKQFRRVFDEAPIGIVLADVEGRLFRVNQAIIQMLGYIESELLAFNFTEITHPEDLARELPLVEQVINKELDGYQIEKRFFKKSQEILWVSLTSVTMCDEAGEVLYALAMIEDITKRKQTEIALRQSEELFRRVFDEAPLGIGLSSGDGYFFRVNQALQNMLGYTESEFKAFTCKDITHPEDWKRKLPYLEQIKKGEIESFQIEERYLKKNQEILWGNLTSIMLKSETGEILYGLGLLEDITERKQAEAEILKALEKEKELSELRSGFVSLVSHEFRTPLTTIQSSTELLERYSPRLSDEKKHNHLRRIQNAVLRMTRLLEDILTIGKVEAGKLKFEPSPRDLMAFCYEIVESMQISVRPHHTLNFVPLCDTTNAWIDEKLLEHIITNLLSNAIKYSPEGGTVQFDLVCTNSWAIFRIQDRGIGIPREDLDNLFESFRRASNVGTIPGTGLGLAIVKKCVELHGGKIVVESEVGVGTTFTVTLPLKYLVS